MESQNNESIQKSLVSDLLTEISVIMIMKKIIVTVCIILLAVSSIYGFSLIAKYPHIKISRDTLYSAENLKDFEIEDGSLTATSDDPWANCDLGQRTDIALLKISVNNINALSGTCQVFDTETWDSQPKRLHKGINYLYRGAKSWNSQYLRFDFVDSEGASIDIEQLSVNPVFEIWLLGFISSLSVLSVLMSFLYWIYRVRSEAFGMFKSERSAFFIRIVVSSGISFVTAYIMILYMRIHMNVTVWSIGSIVFFSALRMIQKPKFCRDTLLTAIWSLVLAIANILGFHIQITGSYTRGLLSTNYIYPYSLFDLFALFVLWFGIFVLTKALIKTIENCSSFFEKRFAFKRDAGYPFAFSVLILFVCWLPYFAVYYPGIILGDSVSSLHQALGMIEMTNHHPVMYTLLLRLCLTLGQTLHSATVGCAIYTIMQMLYIAYVISRLAAFLYDRKTPITLCIIVYIFFAITPYFALKSIVMWKDPIFSASLVLWTILLLEFIELYKQEGSIPVSLYIKNVIILLIICLVRNNGIYVAAFSCLVMVSILLMEVIKKKKVSALAKMICASMSVVILTGILTGPVFSAFGVGPSEKVESLGIPLQQMARVAACGGNLSEKDRQFMETLLPDAEYSICYRPCAVDLLKWHENFNSEYLDEHTDEFMSVYLSILKKNIGLCFEAWELVTFGYWAPNRWEFCDDDKDILKGNLTDFRKSGLTSVIYPRNLLNGFLNVKWDSVFRNKGSIISVAVVNWILLLTVFISVLKKKTLWLIALAPSTGVVVTLLIASPYYYWQRYGLTELYLLPLYLFLIIKGITADDHA